MTAISKKIVLIGDNAVGKTSLIRRYVENQFSDAYLTTIGVKISRKQVSTAARELQLLIWDVEGQKNAQAIAAAYISGAAGAIVVADLSRPETFEALPDLIAGFRKLNAKSPVIIALNKCDLDTAATPPDTLLSLDGVIAWFRTSAKSGENVEAMFVKMADCF